MFDFTILNLIIGEGICTYTQSHYVPKECVLFRAVQCLKVQIIYLDLAAVGQTNANQHRIRFTAVQSKMGPNDYTINLYMLHIRSLI